MPLPVARTVVAVLAACSLATAQTPATQPATDAPQFDKTESAFVPFSPKLNWDQLRSPNVRVSIDGGRPVRLQVDTGSCGIVVGAALVPNIPADAEDGSMVYSSSGNGLYGKMVEVTITFLDSKGPDGKPVSARLPVLAAQERRVTPGAVNSSTRPSAATTTTVTPNPRVYMMGVGFGRGKDPHQERNAFVNLTQMHAGTMHRGYAMTREGFTLGLSKEAVGDGYVWQKLTEKTPSTQMATMRPGLKDWDNARGQVVIDGRPEPDAAVLLDTGLTNMIIGRQEDINGRAIEPVADGTPVTVLLQGGKLKYSFKVGDATNPTMPSKVNLVKRADAPTLNTGLRVLANFDYLYDADNGYLGLRPTR